MEKKNQEAIYCADDDEYRLFFNICDKLCLERFYENHLKSRTHLTNLRQREQLKSSYTNNLSSCCEKCIKPITHINNIIVNSDFFYHR